MDSSPQEIEITHSEKVLAEPPEIFKDEINGKDVYFVGITHNPEYFSDHRQKLEEMIKKGSIIVPEIFPFEKSGNVEAPFDDAEGSEKFYWYVSEVAKREHKTVVCVDPHVEIKFAYAAGAMVGAGLATWLIAYFEALENIKKRKITRGKFLAIAVAGAIGYSLAGASPLNIPLRALESLVKGQDQVVKEASEYGIDDKLAYEAVNYRNVRIARGLDKLTRELPQNSGPIVVIYGAAHPKVIQSYIHDNRFEAEIKSKLYKPFSMVSDETIRTYTPENNTWVLKSRIPF